MSLPSNQEVFGGEHPRTLVASSGEKEVTAQVFWGEFRGKVAESDGLASQGWVRISKSKGAPLGLGVRILSRGSQSSSKGRVSLPTPKGGVGTVILPMEKTRDTAVGSKSRVDINWLPKNRVWDNDRGNC